MKKPFIIGIAGGTGSGKTTIARRITQSVGLENVIIISHDDYYLDQSDLTPEERKKTNYDHPQAYETSLLVKHLQELSAGQTITQPTYDFLQDNRSDITREVTPQPVIIVEGILIFESTDLRKMFDLKVFVDTDSDVRAIRRITRDITENKRDYDYVTQKYLNQVRPMHLQFVEPTKRYADVIIPEGGQNEVALGLLLARVRELAH